MVDLVLRVGLDRQLSSSEVDSNFKIVAADFIGDTAPLVTWPGMRWAHESAGLLKRRSSANTAWEVEGTLFHSAIPTLEKPFDTGPCIIKKTASTASVAAGTYVNAGSAYVHFAAETPISMPTLTAGKDYSVWVKPDGTVSALLDTFAAPASAPALDAVKIGGFHYGLVASGTTVASGGFSTSGVTATGGSMRWTQPDVDKLAGINTFSIWDLAWRCTGEQYGLFYDWRKKAWGGIYMMSDSPHIYGASAYNTNIASGTVLPYIPAEWGGNGVLKYAALNAFTGHELLSAHGLRYPTYDEFMSFAFGVTEGQSLGGASSTVPATLRQPGYTSQFGMEQATGHQWIIGGPIISSGGTAYEDVARGSWYGTSSLVIVGGNRGVAAISGSRAAAFVNALSASYWNFSVRAAGDHLNLGRIAR